MNYIVTGACGFIGARVSEFLLDDEHSVTGIDNINSAYDVRLKNWRLEGLLRRSGFRFSKLDICDRRGLEEIFQSVGRIDGVINLAARAGVRQSIENPWSYLETNCTGTLNLLELSRVHRVPKFVLASTSSLYGSHNSVPYAENGDTNRPLSPYAASKKAAEVLSYSYHHLYGLDITVLRYFTVYGPAGRPDMSLFRFVQWISEDRPVVVLGDGRQSRDFTYVDDIARGTIAALAPAGFETFNLGGDRPMILMDVIRMAEKLLGKSARLEFRDAHIADVHATWADITKARRQLAWSPEIGIEAGLGRLVEWYTQNRAWAQQIETGS